MADDAAFAPVRPPRSTGRRLRRTVGAAVGAVAAFAAFGGLIAGSSRGAGGGSASSCPPARRALEGVYSPHRLAVVNACEGVTGVVTSVRPDNDGDLHMTVHLDPVFEQLTNEGNRQKVGGDLIVEFMPRDRGHLPPPPLGAHIALIGALVLDRPNGWRELHPVWKEILDGGTYSSGPQNGGSVAGANAGEAVAACRTGTGKPCGSYETAEASQPVVAVTSPRPGETVSGRVPLRVQTSPYAAPTSVKWYLDDVEIGWAGTGPPWANAWDSAKAGNGHHRLLAKARVGDGEWETSSSIDVVVANKASAPGLTSQSVQARAASGPRCGVRRRPPKKWRHVVWIVFENKQYSQVIGSGNAPYINSLAGRCGLATSFFAEAHPSLPNYIAMTSGSTQGIADDSGPSSHPLNVANIFTQTGVNGRSLEESMPSNCSKSNSGDYAVRHNPAVYYTNYTQCGARNVPLRSTPDLSAAFTFITPNLCHDMHSSSCAGDTAGEVKNGDAWLSSFLPKVLASKQYRLGTTAVFITWDEDDTRGSQHVPTLVIAPSVRRAARSAKRFDHYSLLRTTQEMLGLRPFLGNAAKAASMRKPFHL
jgi:phosphatidylinositol-3-phosphatase